MRYFEGGAVHAVRGLIVTAGVTLIAFGCGSDPEPAATSTTTATPVDGGVVLVQQELDCQTRTKCGDVCVDTKKDPGNCGACGTACAADKVCDNGTCALACSGGTTACGASCEDLQSDTTNCGACGKTCAAGETCEAGACKTTCATGQSVCPGMGDGGAPYCADLKNDATNCGTCGTSCAVGLVCSNGGCCASGLSSCGGTCTDLKNDEQHCGACGTTCQAGETCYAGGCATTYASCKDLKAAKPGATDGVYTIDPDGANGANTPFDVYCDMTTDGGGWTLLMIATNADGNRSWRPEDAHWVDTSTFGDATNPTLNVDAKSRAYSELNIDEVQIKNGTSGAVEVETNTACMNNTPFRMVFRQNSSTAADCASFCTIKTVSTLWSTGDANLQSSHLRFRCTDQNNLSGADGFTLSTDDNSMITTVSVNGLWNFGIGTGSDGYATDFCATVQNNSDDGVNKDARLVFGR